jgi:type IX secretion system PorP/SprF family membrane protein
MFKKTTGSCLIFLLVSCVTLVAQQDPQFSMNMFNTMAINPGFAGSRDMVCATALPRQQWIGFEGAPVVSSFHVHTPMRPFGISSGLGLVLVTDNIGYEKNLNLNLAYAARFDFANGKLGVGLSGGIINKGLDPEWYIPDKLGSPSTDTGIPQGKESEVALDLNFGVFLQYRRCLPGYFCDSS